MSASILRKQADALFITTWKYNTNGVQRLSVVYTSFVSFTNQYWTITSIQNKLTIVCVCYSYNSLKGTEKFQKLILIFKVVGMVTHNVHIISLRVSDLYDSMQASWHAKK